MLIKILINDRECPHFIKKNYLSQLQCVLFNDLKISIKINSKLEDLLLKYCNYHTDFMGRISSFPEKKKLLKTLNSSKNERQFLSGISDLHFGELFHSLGFEIKYEKKYQNQQTPDWTINVNQETAICEVYRLGESEKDQKRSNFQSQLIEQLEQLIYKCSLQIRFKQQYFDTNKYEVRDIVFKINEWLENSNFIIGEKLIVFDFFSFEIIRNKQKANHVCCIGNPCSIDIKSQKIIQYKGLKNPNELTKKLSKYKTLINEYEMPYFIAVDIAFTSGFNYDDFVEYFRGSGVQNIDYGKVFNGASEMSQYGETWTKLGVFYENPHLSGFILRYKGQFKILLNPMKSQLIYQKYSLLKKFKSLCTL